MSDKNNFVIVELHSDTLVAFDLPFEGARYKIPDFAPGFYKIPLTAIRNATKKELKNNSDNIISVDTGTIFFVDADFYERLRVIENRIWEETKDSYNFIDRHESIIKELGIKYNFIRGGIGLGCDFTGDGSYVLDVSLIKRLPGKE